MSVFSRILCCLSMSENPDDIVQYTRDIALQNEAELILVHVAANMDEVRNRSMLELGDLIEESRRRNEAEFREYAEKHFGDLKPTVLCVEGKVDREVLRVIDQYCADLVIVGSISTKGLLGSLFNKPSESIIGKTRVPVMVIPNELSLECEPDF